MKLLENRPRLDLPAQPQPVLLAVAYWSLAVAYWSQQIRRKGQLVLPLPQTVVQPWASWEAKGECAQSPGIKTCQLSGLFSVLGMKQQQQSAVRNPEG